MLFPHSIWFLAQATSQSSVLIAPPIFWLLFGIVLCLTELFLLKNLATKYRFIALVMGMSALLVSFILWKSSIVLEFDWNYVNYDGFDVQVLYWMGVSITCAIWIRPMFIKRKKYTIPDTTEAKSITEILPGRTGKVLYEGCYWQACCADNQVAIGPNQKVYVLRREGNTLIIATDNLFHP